MKLKLYHYWRSSASWRVRWVFAMKGIPCEFQAINLLSDEAESPEHLARNPLGFVPVLEMVEPDGSSKFISQSLAIIDYAERLKPSPSLFPKDEYLRAYCIQLAEMINADTAPLQNLPVQNQYSDDLEKRKEWARHWIDRGLSGYEVLVQKTAGTYSIGNELSLADICLIPQVYNALRYGCNLDLFPTVKKIYEFARAQESCKKAAPEAFE